jgi:hypothetical protein
VIAVTDAPTRWGPVGFRITSYADRIEASIQAPPGVLVKLRLRPAAEQTITVRGSAEIVAPLR